MSKAKRLILHYLNTDLDIRANISFAQLARRFRKAGMSELYYAPAHAKGLRWKWYGSYEVGWAWGKKGEHPQHTLRAFIKVLERLSPAELKEWRRCGSKMFNIGYQSGKNPPAVKSAALVNELSCDLLKTITEYGAGIVLTIYSDKVPPLIRRQRPLKERARRH